MSRKVLYYSVRPIYETRPSDPPAIATATVVTCMATGRILDGMGGGGLALSPEIVNAIDMRKTGGKPRIVIDAEEYDRLVALTKDRG